MEKGNKKGNKGQTTVFTALGLGGMSNQEIWKIMVVSRYGMDELR